MMTDRAGLEEAPISVREGEVVLLVPFFGRTMDKVFRWLKD